MHALERFTARKRAVCTEHIEVQTKGVHMDKKFDNIALIGVRQTLTAAYPDTPIYPPTYPDNDGNARYAFYTDATGKRGVVIDTHQSQANRIEPMLNGTGLIPDSTVTIDGQEIPFTALGHRVADAAIRFSTGAEEVAAALKDEVALAKLFPSTLLFGAWDSRGDAGTKFRRVLHSEIRANDVSEAVTHLGQFNTSVPKPEGVADKALSAEGILDCPTSGLGGVFVGGEIVRTAQLNVRAIRQMNVAVQDYILGLGLVALLAPASLDLREGCNLFVKSTSVEAINEEGTRQAFDMNYEQALAFAKAAAAKFGVGADKKFTYDGGKVLKQLQKKEEKKGKKAATAA